MIDAVIVINVFLAHSVGSEEPVASMCFDEENPQIHCCPSVSPVKPTAWNESPHLFRGYTPDNVEQSLY